MNMTFNKKIKIGSKTVSENDPVFIIGEAGVNHNGDMSVARELIDAACEAGVDAVKFQTFKADALILSSVPKAPYQNKTTPCSETQYEMLKRLEVSYEQNMELLDYCKKRDILFLSTPFEDSSLAELTKMDLPAFKIAGTDLTNIKFLGQVAGLKKPVILSAGMCYLEEIRMALETINESNSDVVLLHCTANYPIEDHEANLNVIRTLKEEFDVLTGYSDHSKGVGAAPYAVAAGAKVIEKHFTLDKRMAGPDHLASVEPKELQELVNEIRKVETYMGSRIKIPAFSEVGTRRSLQKSLVALKPIAKGEIFTADHITAKRTGGAGIPALYYKNLLGKSSSRDYDKDELIDE